MKDIRDKSDRHLMLAAAGNDKGRPGGSKVQVVDVAPGAVGPAVEDRPLARVAHKDAAVGAAKACGKQSLEQ